MIHYQTKHLKPGCWIIDKFCILHFWSENIIN